MEVFIKQEHWDGGIWMKLPATEEAAEQIYERLKNLHPSTIAPYVGEFAETGLITGLTRCLRGERVFSDGHLRLLNSLAEKMEGWNDGEQVLFTAALAAESPDTLEKVMEVTRHLDQYVWHSEITSMEQLGMYLVGEKKLRLPEELKGFFDYELFGERNLDSDDIMTDYGLVQKKKAPNQSQGENPDAVPFGTMIFHLRVPSDKNQYEKYSLGLPMKESDLEAEAIRLGMEDLAERTDYEVTSKIRYLDSCLPPQSTIEELNQVAWEIWKLADQQEVSREKLLAILEAEAPRTIDMACRVIQHYSDYERLPENSLRPDDYARYLLNSYHVEIPRELEECVRFWGYGVNKLNGAAPYQTSYGPVINLYHALRNPSEKVEEFKLFHSLTLAGYWYDRESSLPEVLTGEESISYKEIVEQRIAKSLADCSDRGLAEYLYHEVLKRQVASMVPGVEEYAGELWGVLTVKTYGELTEREMEGLKAEWREMADLGWGRQLGESPIRLERGELYVDFWDTDLCENLFIKTEAEFKQGYQSGPELG